MKAPVVLVSLAVLALVGPVAPAAADPVSDAESLALELSGELLAPTKMVADIDTHLQAIRAVEPTLGVVRTHAPWQPGVLQVTLTAEAWDEYVAGTYTGLDSLNATYGPLEITEYAFIRMIELDFTAHYNPVLLGAFYEPAPGVVFANPSYTGFTGTDITAPAVGDYTFRYGWLSCPLGCVYDHYWNYAIDGAGAPVLVMEWGDPLVGVDAPEPWKPSGASLRVQPNPFSGATSVSASVPRGTATVEIVDAAGRLVQRLGGGATRWNGRDQSGRPVAGGVYIVLLRSEGAVRATEKVVLLK